MADNMVTLVGALGGDPELRTTPQGADVVNFRMATTERRRGADGRWGDGATSWFRITLWGDLARNAHASLRKGQRVVVHGQLRITEYSGDSGVQKPDDRLEYPVRGKGVALMQPKHAAPAQAQHDSPISMGYKTDVPRSKHDQPVLKYAVLTRVPAYPPPRLLHNP